jgi:type IV secretory pathway TraG/TraD family ATPase VirD4
MEEWEIIQRRTWASLGKLNDPHVLSIPKSKWVIDNNSIAKTETPSIIIDNPYRSIGIFGGAGSGKSESLFKPIIAHAVKNQMGMILYDYKSPELAEFLKNQNPTIPVHHVDFDNPQHSAKVNPIAPRYIKNTLSALELAQSLYLNLNPKSLSSGGDPFWDNSAIAIIQASIWFLKEEDPDNCNIPTLVEMLLHDMEAVLELLKQNDKCKKLVASILSGSGSEKLLASIASVVQSPLSRLIEDDIAHIMSSDEAQLDVNDPENPSILILGMNQENPQAYSPLVSLIITAALRRMNKADKHPSIVILDEAPTIYIPKIEDYPAVTRSRKIAFVYGAQDISQIDKAYGKDRRQALITNLGYQFFGRTPNSETIQYITRLFGKEDWRYFTSSSSQSSSSNSSGGSSSESQSQSESIQQRDRITPEDILQFVPGQFAVISDSRPEVVNLSAFGQFAEKMNFKATRKIPKKSFWKRLFG